MNLQSTPASPPIFPLKAPRQPMLWAVVAYSLGIIAGVYLWRPLCGGSSPLLHSSQPRPTSRVN